MSMSLYLSLSLPNSFERSCMRSWCIMSCRACYSLLFYLFLSSPVGSYCSILPCTVLSRPIVSSFVLSCPVFSYVVLCSTGHFPVLSSVILFCPICPFLYYPNIIYLTDVAYIVDNNYIIICSPFPLDLSLRIVCIICTKIS